MSKHKSIYSLGDNLLCRENFNTNKGRLLFLLSQLCLNRFKWENLPPSIEPRHIEKALFEHGQCFVFEHKEYGLIALPCNNSNQLNIYGEPTHVTVVGVGESFGQFNVKTDGVRILSNELCYPNILHIAYYTEMIAKTDETMLKNLEKLKMPYIIATTKENELTHRAILKKIKDGEDEIFVDSMLSNGGKLGIEILNTGVNLLIDKLQAHKNNLMNEFLTIMGLNNTNANNDKKERLLVDEVNVNNGEILMYSELEYKMRLTACEQINRKYGTNISVKKYVEELSNQFQTGEGGGLDG